MILNDYFLIWYYLDLFSVLMTLTSAGYFFFQIINYKSNFRISIVEINLFGCFVVSIILILLLLLNLLNGYSIFLLKFFFIVFLIFNFKKFYYFIEFKDYPLTIYFIALVFIFLAITQNFFSINIHPDSEQYHLGIPYLMAKYNETVTGIGIMHSGNYLGFDILYLLFNNLARLDENIEFIRIIKIFESIYSSLVIFVFLKLTKTFSKKKYIIFLSILIFVSISDLHYIGYLKNDVFVTSIFLLCLYHLLAYEKNKKKEHYILFLLFGIYSISVKITVFLPFILILIISNVFLLKKKIFKFNIFLIFLLPWIFYSFSTHGTPAGNFFFNDYFKGKISSDIKHIQKKRSQIKNLKIEGKLINIKESLIGEKGKGFNYISFFCILTSAFFILSKSGLFIYKNIRFEFRTLIGFVILLYLFLFIFKYSSYRINSRYLIFIPTFFIPYVLNEIDKIKIKNILILIILIIISFSNYRYNFIYAKFKNIYYAYQDEKFYFLQNDSKINKWKEDIYIFKQFKNIAIVDHVLLFRKKPLVNLHQVHARYLDLPNQDINFLKKLLKENFINHILYRKSSGTSQVLEIFIQNCGEQVYESNHYKLFKINYEC